jgi:hypothetical protein
VRVVIALYAKNGVGILRPKSHLNFADSFSIKKSHSKSGLFFKPINQNQKMLYRHAGASVNHATCAFSFFAGRNGGLLKKPFHAKNDIAIAVIATHVCSRLFTLESGTSIYG